MDFLVTQQQRDVRDLAEHICDAFDESYWLAKDESGEFPEEFYRAVADAGLLGIAMPEEYGGSGLGIAEAAVLMQTIAGSGACMSGASSIHMNIFGLNPVVVFGSDAQRRRMLPPLIRGEHKACFAVTEPDAGLNMAKIRTKAEWRGDHYVISGQKVWISTAQVANKMLILARTTPYEQVKRKTDGLSLFYTDLDRVHVELRAIRKMGRHAVDSNILFIDSLKVPEADRIGTEGDGFRMILHGLNPERILIAAEAVGIGSAAIRRAAAYAKERVVFDRAIGEYQGIQHPLAKCWMQLEAAKLMVMKAASLYDSKEDCGLEANSAKYLAAEAAAEACQTAVLTHGGMGYSAEYHVERYLRESFIPRIAPISSHMILNFVAEKALGLPKSY